MSPFQQVKREITLHNGHLNFQVQTLDRQFTLPVKLVHLERRTHNVDHQRRRRAAEDSVVEEVNIC